ncbi:MAG: hypothetical protein AAF682_05660 [Planctomycetota bacterium]
MRYLTFQLLSFALATTLPQAQTLDRAVPAAAMPGDLVILQGSGLDLTTSVRFTGETGFPSGTTAIDVTPESVTATEVRARVPLFLSFAGCQVTPQSTAYGSVEVVGSFVAAPAPLEFFFMEEPGSEVFAVGLGNTQPSGIGRPVISFDIQQGPPRIPITGFTKAAIPCTPKEANPNLVVTLENAEAGGFAYLYHGPLAFPFLPFGDGTMVLNPGVTALVASDVVAADGTVEVPISFLVGFSGEIAFQWGVVDPTFTQISLSNGLWTGF